MNSREIVRRTLAFQSPERVARSFEPSDLVVDGAHIPNLLGEWRQADAHRWRRTDEWGNVWERADDTSKGQVVKGVLDDLSKVDACPLPDFSDPAYYELARQTFIAHPDKWHIGSVQGFTFKMAQQLRRFDQYLMDLMTSPNQIHHLHDRIDEQICHQIMHLDQVGADSIMFWEDWGTQQQMIISPRLWRSEFKPRFASLIAYAHSLHLSVVMHSCGKMAAVIPDLIECGVDVFQFDQLRIHGIDQLAELQQHARITFWSPVDVQATLPTQDELAIRRDADEMLTKLWAGRGGFIAGFYNDAASLGLGPEWQQIACEEFMLKGVNKMPEVSSR